MTRRTPVALAAALLVALLGGCGIPDETDVRVDGQVPNTLEYGAANGGGPAPPRRLDSGDDARQFAMNFLEAAAGESSHVYERVKDYLAPGKRTALKEKQGSEVAVNVVRLREETPHVEAYENGTYTVTIPVQQVGVLRSDGILAPPVATDQVYTFTIGKAEVGPGIDSKAGSGLYVLSPPPVLLLSDQALKTYYHEQTIYFWNTDRTALVPDLRYLPLEVPSRRQATDVLGWLIGGPSDWLASAAVPLPDGTEQLGTVPQTGDRLEVNLSALPGTDEDVELDRLATQLARSLPDLRGELELKIRNQTRKVISVAEHLRFNPVYPQTANPQQFCVYGGLIRPLVSPGQPAASTPIAPEANHNVVTAALGRGGDGVLAALVSAADDGRFRLQVATGATSVTRLHQGDRSYGSMGRPVWLKTADATSPVGLIVADGHLFRFGASDPALSEVTLPGATGPVTSVGAALDGSRIAFIAGGGLYVAALTVDGAAGGAVTVTAGPARRLNTSLRDPVEVDWSSETQLAVAGVNATTNPAIYEVNVDGGLETTLNNDTGARVTHLVAYPTNPEHSTPSRVMYEANKVSWVMRYSSFEKIGREQVADVPPSPAPGSSANPTAPFFYY